MSLIYTFLIGQDYLFVIALVHIIYMQNTLLITENEEYKWEKKEKENYYNSYCWHLKYVCVLICLDTCFLQICKPLHTFFVYTFIG